MNISLRETGILGQLLLCTFLMIVSSQLQAADEFNQDALLLDLYAGQDELIMLATGTPMLVSKAPAVSTVITAKQIKAMGATDIDQVLETVPGLHVSSYYQLNNPVYIFRGAYTVANPQVLFMINGIPMKTLFSGSAHNIWGGMPVEAISRIEVVRGPASAVYGADAFSGVINIITKGGNELNGTEFGVRAGNFSSRDAWLTHGTQWQGFELGLMLEFHRTDGHGGRIENDAQTALDQAYGTNASYAPGEVNLTRKNLDLRLDLAKENWRWRLGLQQRGNVGTNAGVAQALDPAVRYASERWNSDLTWHDSDFTDWDLQLQLSLLHTTQELYNNNMLILFPPGSAPFGDVTGDNVADPFPNGLIGNPENWERHFRLETTAIYSGFNEHQIRLGLGRHYGNLYRSRETKNFGIDPTTGLPTFPTSSNSPVFDVSDTPYVYMPEGGRGNLYTYVQDIWNFAPDWHLTTGLRHDRYSDFGNTTNPRIALVWWTDYNFTTKLMHGRAFRSPSFIETRLQANPVVLGNPDLKPEKIATTELAFDYRPTDTLAYELNFFRYSWDEKIEAFVGSGQEQARNLGKQTGHGLEFTSEWQAKPNLAFMVNYAWQKSTNENLSHDAGNAPHHQLYARSDWAFKHDWQLNLQLNWVGERKREAGDTRSPVPDYTTVDGTVRYSPNKTPWQLAVIAYNLFDETPLEPSLNGNPGPAIPGDIPQAGRSLMAEARYHF